MNNIFKRIKSKYQKCFLTFLTEHDQKKFTHFNSVSPLSKEFQNEIENISIEFIFTEFGENRVNAGGAALSNENRLEPTLSNIKKFFPEASVIVYTDFDLKIDGVITKRVESPVVDSNHPRFGYRTGNYFKFLGMLSSKADFCCALDTDMYFVNHHVYSLVTLTKKFGFCVPQNVRQLLNFDMRTSLDTKPITDDSLGNGYSYNQSPMTLWKNDERGRLYYQKCLEIMKKDPSRGSLVMWKAAWETGIHPYALPKQFCVCEGDQGCGDEIILHLGHPSIAKYYKL